MFVISWRAEDAAAYATRVGCSRLVLVLFVLNLRAPGDIWFLPEVVNGDLFCG